jgi:folylpolyglutamate synthase
MSKRNLTGPSERNYRVSLVVTPIFPTVAQNAIEITNWRCHPARPSSKSKVVYTRLDKMPDLKGKSDMRGTLSIVGMK